MKCFYHSADLDGHCSAAIVKSKYPECELIGINYGKPFPWEKIYAGSGIILHDFVQIAPRCTFVSESDDFSGHSLVGPCVPMKFKPQYERGTIVLYRHVLMGAHCVVLPGVILNEGAAVGAGSVVTKDCYTWSIYAGVPAKYKKLRSTAMKDLERQFLEEYYGRRCA